MNRKCIQNSKPTPQDLPDSIFNQDCDYDINSIDEFCTHYETFLDWVFESCSHSNKDAKKVQLKKRCDKIKQWS